MKCTVAICTWNRAALLEQTLAEMCRLHVAPGFEWELLVVNNNCSDHTDDVLARFRDSLPLRRLFEPRPGQCHARNCAIEAARGDLIVWTDDDVLVSADWLMAYAKAREDWPGAGFFGGPVTPWFDGRPPHWLERSWPAVSGAFAVRQRDERTLDLATPRELPYGANFAVVRSLQQRFLYNPALGLRPGSAIRGDEVDVLRKFLSEGVEGKWVAAAAVRHFIPADRQRTQYLREYYYGVGQTVALTEQHPRSPEFWGLPRWLLRLALESEVRFQVTRFTSSSDVWLRHLAQASECWGQLSGIRQNRWCRRP